MKNFRLIMLRIAFLAAAMMFSNMAWGQEMILEIPLYHEHSIVRHIDDQSALIYNYSGRGNYFIKIDVSNPSIAQYKALNNYDLKVLDFEIFDNTVYFCGKTNTTNPHALFGYFHIANFPDGDIYIDSVMSLMEFKKLDVFSVEGTIHVAMTATGLQSIDAIVDVRSIASNAWQYEIVNAPKEVFAFDDVAVTNESVMFSGRLTQAAPFYSAYTSAFWEFPKPNYPGMSLFYSTSGISRLQLNSTPSGPVCITALDGNQTESAFDIGDDKWELVGLNGMTYFGSVTRFKDSSERVSDIRAINNKTRSLVPITSLVQTDIFEATSFTLAPLNYPYKLAHPEIIRSIDRIPSGRTAVGVGQTSSNQALRFYLLDYYYNEDCVPIQHKIFPLVNRYDELTKIDVKVETVFHEFGRLGYGKGDISTEIICGNK